METIAALTAVRPAQANVREWRSLVTEIAKIDVAETEGALRMGDLFAEIVDTYGDTFLKKAALEAGITLGTAQERLRVARRIPLSSPIRRMRTMSYSHLRAVARTNDPERWAQQAEEKGLTVRQLLRAIEQEGDRAAADDGALCGGCDRPLPAAGVVAVTIDTARTRTCSCACARRYLDEWEAAGMDPFG